MSRHNISCQSFINLMSLFHLLAINFSFSSYFLGLSWWEDVVDVIGGEVYQEQDTNQICLYSNYLRSLFTSLPFSYVFIIKLRLYLCGLLNGKHPWTILVLENKILLKLSPALLIGCSYIFIYLLININYINSEFNTLINNIKN